jgi:hypothetical protein
MTTKILALIDALGNLVRFELLPGHQFDTIGVAPLIKDIQFDALLGDKAFDSNWIVEELDQRGAQVVISQRPHAPRSSKSTPRCMNGSTLLRTISANSKSSSALQ